jgi:hypothetical protein
VVSVSYSRPQIHRIDSNHHDLVGEWEKLGGVFLKCPPFDGWIWHPTWDAYQPVEIKDPKREGHKNEYTKAQKKLMDELKPRGAPWLVWRTIGDVRRTLMREEGVL